MVVGGAGSVGVGGGSAVSRFVSAGGAGVETGGGGVSSFFTFFFTLLFFLFFLALGKIQPQAEGIAYSR